MATRDIKARFSKGKTRNVRRNVDPQLFDLALSALKTSARIVEGPEGVRLASFVPGTWTPTCTARARAAPADRRAQGCARHPAQRDHPLARTPRPDRRHPVRRRPAQAGRPTRHLNAGQAAVRGLVILPSGHYTVPSFAC
jgi:hypothetical protein